LKINFHNYYYFQLSALV